MSHRRSHSVRVANVVVPEHFITAAKRHSVQFATQPHYSIQRRPTLGEVPQEDVYNVSDVPQIPSNHHPEMEGQFTENQTWEKYTLQRDSLSTESIDKADIEEYAPDDVRRSKRRTIHSMVPDSVQTTVRNVTERLRKSSIYEVYEKAKERGVELERKRWLQVLFEYSFYALLLAFAYFVMIGKPLWNGTLYYTYVLVSTKFVLAGGWAITVGLATLYAFFPLFFLFEKDPPTVERPADFDCNTIPGIETTALLIPCYKSANIIGPTLVAALKVFPAKNIFVLANGNSETPLDDTEKVCSQYGVNHLWCPVGSKIIAQFVGCYAAKEFEHVLLIDDDCAIPPNFPIVSERLVGNIKCIGYTIKSVGPNSSKGTWCTQAQDLEYKLSGLQRAAAGNIGSAIFPHGAISLWDRAFLIETFYDHPGFSVSEDWFFGHSCRRLGGRIKMCSAVFVETETPDALFFGNGANRGGFGEMTVFKQRFLRWNFFFVNGIFYDLGYILFSWRLGWWEIGTKLIVFQEVYETLIYLLTPFVLPICFVVNPSFSGYLLLATLAMYFVNVIIFNELHLRRKNERISWAMLLAYYTPYKLALSGVNVISCYWSLFKYAQYFAKPHLKVTEDEKAVGVVLQLDEEMPASGNTKLGSIDENNETRTRGRSMIIDVVGSRVSIGVGKGSRMSRRKGQRISVLSQGQLVYLPQGEPFDPEMDSIAGAARSLAAKQYEKTTSEQGEEQGVQAAALALSSGSEEKNEVNAYTSRRKSSWAQSYV